jgi:spoIIIJ-associated protein
MSERGNDEARDPADGDVPTVEAAATTFLQGLTSAFGLTAEVSVVPVDGDDDELEARVEGQDLGVLIGPAGQTLVAVQELTRLAVQQQRGGVRGGWLRVDVSGYRVKRREALERFTTQVVEQVKASGSAKALEPMNAADRKVVHDTATRLGGVATSSEGEEPRRRVVIRPA